MSKLSQSEIDALFAQYAAGEDPAAMTQGLAAISEPEAQEAPAPAAFAVLEPAPPHPGPQAPIGLLSEVELDVAVRLGQTRRSIREILSLTPGSVLELDNLAGEVVDILVNGLLIAKGEVVVVGENYGVRITELVTTQGGLSA